LLPILTEILFWKKLSIENNKITVSKILIESLNETFAAEFEEKKMFHVLQFSNVQKTFFLQKKNREEKKNQDTKKLSFSYISNIYCFLPPAMTAMIALF
jgi:hypothetical protein